MLVRALMTGAPITLPPDISIVEARRLMDGARIRHVLVTLGGSLLGIVTDRDIRLNMPSQATSLSVWELNYLLAKVTVGEVMTRPVITIGSDLDARDAAQIMLDHKFGALPVIDEGRLIGLLTETACFARLSRSAPSRERCARDRRNPDGKPVRARGCQTATGSTSCGRRAPCPYQRRSSWCPVLRRTRAAMPPSPPGRRRCSRSRSRRMPSRS